MALLPNVVRAEHAGGFRIRLTFNDGLEAIVYFRPLLAFLVSER
jgi:hypothetical protein